MARGFTLMEMVIAIILLGIVGLFLGNVAGQAMGIAATSSSREALIQQGRFITERLSREIREAVPNSVMVANGCIEFLPIVNSAIYQSLPTNTVNTLRLLPITKSIQAGEHLVISPNDPAALRAALLPAAGQIAEVASSVDFTSPHDRTMVNVTLTQPTSFDRQSPARRVYFYRTPVAFCYENNQIYRYSNYDLDRTALQPSQLGSGVLMAENLSQASFEAAKPELQRNGLIKIELTFEDRGEKVEFVHNALIYNAP